MLSWEAGNPSFIVVLNVDIINSLNNIIASDQKGINFILHSHNNGISRNILSVNGSIMAPNLVLRFEGRTEKDFLEIKNYFKEILSKIEIDLQLDF